MFLDFQVGDFAVVMYLKAFFGTLFIAGNEKSSTIKKTKTVLGFLGAVVFLLHNKCCAFGLLFSKAMSSNLGSPKVHLKSKRFAALLWHFAFFTVCLIGFLVLFLFPVLEHEL